MPRESPAPCDNSDKPRLLQRGVDEGSKQWMRLEGTRLQLGMVLHADEPRMISEFDRFGQQAVRRHSGKYEAALLEILAIVGIDFVTVAMAFENLRRVVDLGDLGARLEIGPIGAEAHRSAEVAAGAARLELVAAKPFGHQADDRRIAGAELGRIRSRYAGKGARSFDDRHLHA